MPKSLYSESRDEHEASQLVNRLASSQAERGEAEFSEHMPRRDEANSHLLSPHARRTDPSDSAKQASHTFNSLASSHKPRRVGSLLCYVKIDVRHVFKRLSYVTKFVT
jgi:hypothetical protein